MYYTHEQKGITYMHHHDYCQSPVNLMPPHKRFQRQTDVCQQSLWNTSAKHWDNIVTYRTSQRDELSSKNITWTLRCITHNYIILRLIVSYDIILYTHLYYFCKIKKN